MMTATATLHTDVIRALRIGFRLAAGLMLIGIAVALIRQEALETTVDPIQEIPGALADGRARAFIDLAIIAIVLTPVAAIVTIWRGFMAQGDRRFAGYSLGVLGILVASITYSLVR